MKRRSLILFLCLLLSPVAAAAQISQDINARIRAEEMQHSQIMRTLHYLTDVYGPRLTGSPNAKRAGEWAIAEMTRWGLSNGHLEPWDFGHEGWVNERLTAHITAPVKDALVCEVLAWTPSTRGVVTAPAVQINLPNTPTQAELDAFFAAQKAQVRGRIVLIGKPQIIPVNFNPPPKRFDDEQLRQRYGLSTAPAPAVSPSPTPAPTTTLTLRPDGLAPAQVFTQFDQFLRDSGALVRVNDAGREHGQIRAFNNRTYDLAKVIPTVVMRNEDYGRIWRLLDDKLPVTLEFNIVNRTYPEGKTSYNTIAEIPGTDKKDEVIMLGGHLDSWHAATGATDNAIGCAVMMEAARIIQTLGLKPRRTIRVALWTGEEEGLLGSQAYVKEHFGSAENPKPEFAKFGGYFNVDTGTGRIRAASVFGTPETAAALREIMSPFADQGFVGVAAGRSRGLGGSDNTSFNNAGLPGIGLGQDPVEYFTHTWHTNLDTYERIVEDDVKQNAIIVATTVYQLAMRDELLPRFTSAEMPAAPPTRPEPATAQPAPPRPAANNPRRRGRG